MYHTAMPNRLANQSSPYLRQHADNPVDWYPWGDEALALAKSTGKPILLSIGYSTCHWCHVMARESFADPQIAATMNEHFINIKVDREERPDLDKVYQTALQLLSPQGGGWPLTMFLDPNTQIPFFGGTYFPNKPRYQLPGFADLLLRIAEVFRTQPDELAEQAGKLTSTLAQLVPPRLAPTAEDQAVIDQASGAIGAAVRPDPRRIWQRPQISHDTHAGAPAAPLGKTTPSRRQRPASPGYGHDNADTGLRAAASTTTSAGAFFATPLTVNGSCRTSRKCCTTMHV